MPAGTSYLVKEGMLSKTMTKVKLNGEDCLKFCMKNQFVHAVHPLGWLKRVEISIDGQEYPESKAYFSLRGQTIRVDNIHTIRDIFWDLCETMDVYVLESKDMQPGVYKIKVTLVTSVLEDTRILDLDGRFGDRVEFVETDIELV